MSGAHPEILEQPVIPRQLHGVNPRAIMGQAAWDLTRRAVYRRHAYRCAACGTAAREAKFSQALEAHERFTIDYATRTMSLTGMEPLCLCCHRFVHAGFMEVLLSRGRMSRDQAVAILEHGTDVLRSSGRVPAAADLLCRRYGIRHGLRVAAPPPEGPWGGWRMIWDGKIYPSPYASERDWERAMARAS